MTSLKILCLICLRATAAQFLPLTAYPFNFGTWVILHDAVLDFDAASGQNSAALTPARKFTRGMAWYGTAFNFLTGFRASFSFTLSSASSPPADGICFVIQNSGLNAGSVGDGIGYAGLPGGSVAISFDTYSETLGRTTPNIQTTDVWTNGNLPQYSPNSFRIAGNIADGNRWAVDITYSGGVMAWSLTSSSGARQSFSRAIDIRCCISASAPRYWGFTAATGGSYARHAIFSPMYAPICTATAPVSTASVRVTALTASQWAASCAPSYVLLSGASPSTLTASPVDCSISGALPICVPQSATRTSTQTSTATNLLSATRTSTRTNTATK